MKKFVVFSLSLFFLTGFAQGATYYVDASKAYNSGAGLSWSTVQKTIQMSMNLTDKGDTGWVTNGAYYLNSEILVDTDIIIESIYGSDVRVVGRAKLCGWTLPVIPAICTSWKPVSLRFSHMEDELVMACFRVKVELM